MFFSRPIHCYHFQADPIWPDGTFKSDKRFIKKTSGPLEKVQIIALSDRPETLYRKVPESDHILRRFSNKNLDKNLAFLKLKQQL